MQHGTNKKKLIIDHIKNEINLLDIAGYLKEEIFSIIEHIHYYKLKNIVTNIETLKIYLHKLDHRNTEQIHKLDHMPMDIQQEHEHNIHFYISQKGLEKVGKEKIQQKIWQNDINLNYIMQGIIWCLILTIDEFCNASPTRMFINKHFREQETSPQNKKKTKKYKQKG